jgi:hypothetical protein
MLSDSITKFYGAKFAKRRIRPGMLSPNAYTGLVVIKNENQLLSEKQAQLGTTRESTLQTVLGRVP